MIRRQDDPTGAEERCEELKEQLQQAQARITELEAVARAAKRLMNDLMPNGAEDITEDIEGSIIGEVCKALAALEVPPSS